MGDHYLYMVSGRAFEHQIDVARPFIERVAARTRGARTTEGIVNRIRRGEWQMWFVMGEGQPLAVIGTALFIRDDGRKSCDIVFLAGTGLRSWGASVLAEIEQWAIQNDCTVMNATARPGMKIILEGYRVGSVEFHKEIGNG